MFKWRKFAWFILIFRAHYKEGNIEKAYRYILHAVDIYAGDDRVNLYMLKLQQRLTT